MLWADVKRHFSFPEDKEQLFKDWVMKKMAIAFQTFKKKLNNDYVKKGLTPDFEKDFKNQRPYWEAFVQYKSSEDSEKKTAQAKENASKKKHFHHLGQGDMRRRFRNGRRWKMISFSEESYRRLSTGRCKQNITSTLMEAH